MRTLWFGTRGYERWIKMPRVDMSRGQYGIGSRSDHRNGGATIQSSLASHYEAVMEWGGEFDSQQAKAITDVLSGLYGTPANRGLIYFVDPAAAALNAFSEVWAAPFIAGVDGPSLTKGIRPTLADTPSNTWLLPPRSATFTVTGATSFNTFYVPIPPGFSARFAFYGPTAQSSKIRVHPYTAGVAGSATDYGVLANSGYGTGQTAISGVDGIEFQLTPIAGTVTLTTALLQIAPIGYSLSAPSTFLSGGGHSGCYVDGTPSQTLNSAVTGRFRESLSVRLVEQGSWL